MIRTIEAGDRSTWTDLWTQYLAFYETVLPQEVYESSWSRLLDSNEPTWGALAFEAGEPVGLVHHIFHRTNWAIADVCYLQDLYVTPEHRGRGHARALIGHVAAAARAHGSPRVYWLTRHDNTTARALYDSVAEYSGFVQYRMSPSPD